MRNCPELRAKQGSRYRNSEVEAHSRRRRQPHGVAFARRGGAGDYLGVDYVDDEVSHERLALWPLSDRNAKWVVRSPDGDEWAEDLSCVDPNFGPSRPGLSHGSVCDQEEEECSLPSKHNL